MKNVILGIIGLGLVVGFAVLANKEVNVDVTPNLSALTSPDITSPYLAVNGVKKEYRFKALETATTTPCALQSPAATSTVEFAGIAITTGTSTATTWTVAKAATPYATTTIINSYSLGSGALGEMTQHATSSISGANVIGPNQYVVWGVAGTTIADSTKLLGTCQAEFRVL